MSVSLYTFRIINDTDNTSLPDAFFNENDAIKTADKLKKTAKNKLEFRVVKTIPVYSTKEKVEESSIDFF